MKPTTRPLVSTTLAALAVLCSSACSSADEDLAWSGSTERFELPCCSLETRLDPADGRLWRRVAPPLGARAPTHGGRVEVRSAENFASPDPDFVVPPNTEDSDREFLAHQGEWRFVRASQGDASTTLRAMDTTGREVWHSTVAHDLHDLTFATDGLHHVFAATNRQLTILEHVGGTRRELEFPEAWGPLDPNRVAFRTAADGSLLWIYGQGDHRARMMRFSPDGELLVSVGLEHWFPPAVGHEALGRFTTWIDGHIVQIGVDPREGHGHDYVATRYDWRGQLVDQQVLDVAATVGGPAEVLDIAANDYGDVLVSWKRLRREPDINADVALSRYDRNFELLDELRLEDEDGADETGVSIVEFGDGELWLLTRTTTRDWELHESLVRIDWP